MDHLRRLVARFFPHERVVSQDDVRIVAHGVEGAAQLTSDAAVLWMPIKMAETDKALYFDLRPHKLFQYQLGYAFAAVLLVPLLALFAQFGIDSVVLAVLFAVIVISMWFFYNDTKGWQENPVHIARIPKDRVLAQEDGAEFQTILSQFTAGRSYCMLSALSSAELDYAARDYPGTFEQLNLPRTVAPPGGWKISVSYKVIC
jgi:hypothetical protein